MTDLTSIIQKMKNNGKLIDKYLETRLKGPVPNLWDAARHYITAGGKRLRPFLVCNCYRLLSENLEPILPIASAVEVLHNFTLIHDDIMDKDQMRRNVPTVHTKWGEPIAILAGDLLFALVFTLINESKLTDSQKSKISQTLGQVSIDLCNGQALDMNFPENPQTSLSDYLEMIRLKTGALCKASMRVGGIGANMNESQLKAVEDFGEKLGLGFQIADDILGLIGEEAKLGKPIGSDIREGKKTFLALYALNNLEIQDHSALLQILTSPKKSEQDIQIAANLILKTNAVEKAQEQAESYIAQAINAISIFPDSETRQDLIAVARLSIKRET